MWEAREKTKVRGGRRGTLDTRDRPLNKICSPQRTCAEAGLSWKPEAHRESPPEHSNSMRRKAKQTATSVDWTSPSPTPCAAWCKGEESRVTAQVAQIGCGVYFTGDIKKPLGHYSGKIVLYEYLSWEDLNQISFRGSF